MSNKFAGCFPAVVTAFKEEGSRRTHPINYDAMDMLVEHVAKGGVTGVVVAGCTGAASVLNHNEQVSLVNHIQSNFGKELVVVAGDGSNSTEEAVKLAQRMESEAGVFAHLSISPYYNKPSDEGLVQHYTEIADNIEGELILYSVPGRTGGKGILPAVAARLSEHPRIVGIKEASGDIDRIKETIRIVRDRNFFVTSGDDGKTLDIMAAGGVGAISVAANIIPGRMSKMVDLALNGKYLEARGIEHANSGIYDALFPKSEHGSPSPNPVLCYYALKKIGIPVGTPRLPLTDAVHYEKEFMDRALAKMKLAGK